MKIASVAGDFSVSVAKKLGLDKVLADLNRKFDGIGNAPNRTGTVWDNITSTADNLPNTQIPATFKLKSGSSEFYVNSNATKHMGEYLQKSSNPINDQQLLNSFSGAVENIVSSGNIQFGKVYNVDGWEVIFSQRAGDALPVIKHALYKP
jgi:filamentous hemagglutinin